MTERSASIEDAVARAIEAQDAARTEDSELRLQIALHLSGGTQHETPTASDGAPANE